MPLSVIAIAPGFGSRLSFAAFYVFACAPPLESEKKHDTRTQGQLRQSGSHSDNRSFTVSVGCR
jgi:hypothetical protein